MTDKTILTPHQAERICGEIRSKFTPLQDDLNRIPAALEGAKKAGSAAEIRECRARETQLHESLLDACTEARTHLSQVLADFGPSSNKKRDDFVAALEAEKTAMTALKAEFVEKENQQEARIKDAEKALGDFEHDCRLTIDALTALQKELTDQIASSAEAA